MRDVHLYPCFIPNLHMCTAREFLPRYMGSPARERLGSALWGVHNACIVLVCSACKTWTRVVWSLYGSYVLCVFHVCVQNQMQMYPPYFMSGVPQGQRAYFPTVASFRPWQGTPMHGRTYGFMPNQRRAMGGGGPRPQMPRPSGQQRLGSGTRSGMDRMQQQTGQQASTPCTVGQCITLVFLSVLQLELRLECLSNETLHGHVYKSAGYTNEILGGSNTADTMYSLLSVLLSPDEVQPNSS